ncbi:hypothetical protein EW026_g4420 [Hermanssonia centrifuga]|uniref:GH18 domain-containing protein n=1 Tax=Hermanssonia centrifuga TaxID=98765 RepID=A0A4S4KH51_9APHY|nr:hypothetical protein EW026_g4420 [Hermanssonia centrifuga]
MAPSRYFSPAVSNAQNMQTFATNILATYNQFNLDGIDIDWEYPGQPGNDGNIVNANDTANYLAFLQLLRNTLPPTAKITAATMTIPWADPQGNPMTDVSGFAQVLDWILLMNYDTWGSSPSPGPNAPLSNACHNSTQGSASALAAVEAWTSAGFPPSKMVLGVPSYGYISRSSETVLQTRHIKHRRSKTHHTPIHDLTEKILPTSGTTDSPLYADAMKPTPVPGVMVANDDGGTDNGQVQFRDLINQGILQYIPAIPAFGPNSTSTDPETSAELTRIAFAGQQITNLFTALSGFERKWDACSSTPFLQSSSAKQVVSYDDPQSLEMKAVFVREAGLLGVNMFDVHGDTDQWDLTDGIRRGLGL